MTDVLDQLLDDPSDPLWVAVLKSPAESLVTKIDLVNQDIIRTQHDLLSQIEQKHHQ